MTMKVLTYTARFVSDHVLNPKVWPEDCFFFQDTYHNVFRYTHVHNITKTSI